MATTIEDSDLATVLRDITHDCEYHYVEAWVDSWVSENHEDAPPFFRYADLQIVAAKFAGQMEMQSKDRRD
jgi:hypothetical protein